MEFKNLKLNDIQYTIRYKATQTAFSIKNKPYHIVGLKLSGSALHTFKNQSFNLKENYLYFLNQKDDYDVVELEPGVAFSVHFTAYEPIETDSFCVTCKKTEEVLKILERIEKGVLEGTDENQTRSDFYKLCSLIYNTRKNPYAGKDKRMAEIKAYINTNFKEKNCLDAAAEKCGVSRRRFNDLFKNYFGITPNNYIIAIKTDLAKKLLENDYLSILYISDYCGFSDVSYFSKVFKQKTGSSPSNYRANIKRHNGDVPVFATFR